MSATMYKFIFITIFSASIFSCSQNSKKQLKYINDYQGKDVEQLIRAIDQENIKEIDYLVNKNKNLLKYSDSLHGSGVLEISLDLEKFDSFKRLLELGADPNSINIFSRYSILIESIKSFGDDREWREDNRYALLLLSYNADPNYIVEKGFEDNKKHYHIGSSPLLRASSLNLEIVKELVKYGADVNKRIDGVSPFAASIMSGNYNVSKYYLEILHTKPTDPLILREGDNLFVQDLIINKFTHAKVIGDSNRLDDLRKKIPDIDRTNIKRWQMIKYLEKCGVNFKNYNYRKKYSS